MGLKRTIAACGILLAGIGLLLADAQAAVAATPSSQASTSRAAREDALKSIPFDQFDDDAKQKLVSVVRQTTVFRRLPVQVADCDPNLHLFLVRHPEVVIGIWKRMGVTVVDLERTGPESFNLTDDAGTKGTVEFLFGDADTHVIYTSGEYRGPLSVRPLKAEAIVILKSGYVKDRQGRDLVVNRIDAFIHIQNLGAKAIAKTFHRIFGRTADHNFAETVNFITLLSRTAERNGPGVQRLAGKLEKVDPKIRAEFARLAGEVHDDATATQQADASLTAPQIVRGQYTTSEATTTDRTRQ